MKKILIGLVAAVGIVALNFMPIKTVSSQGDSRDVYGVIEVRCPDGIGTYKKCAIGGWPICLPGTIFLNTCNPLPE